MKKIKQLDVVQLSDGSLCKVVSVSDSFVSGVRVYSLRCRRTLDFEVRDYFVWGAFRLRRGVWRQYNPFSAM